MKKLLLAAAALLFWVLPANAYTMLPVTTITTAVTGVISPAAAPWLQFKRHRPSFTRRMHPQDVN
jgi:hypothetical protein